VRIAITPSAIPAGVALCAAACWMYFGKSFIDASGNPLAEVPGSQNPVTGRIAFKVPRSARTGYLFYWGLYWGPLEFADH
jgi:hypothetical protein